MKVQELRFLYIAENLSDGARASINSSQMPAASLIKLYIAGCVYEQMDFVKEQEVLRRRNRRTFAFDDYGKRQ